LKQSTLKCLEPLLKSPEKEISHPFIVACVPEIVNVLERTQVNHINTEIELLNFKEYISILELILSLVKPEDCEYNGYYLQSTNFHEY